MKRICSKQGSHLATIVEVSDWRKGLNFYSDESDFIQVGTWWYQEGTVLARHEHKFVERISNITQECLVVVKGALSATIYDESREHVTKVQLKSGDIAIFLRGGHEYEILEEDTRVIEAKNGPFMGVQIDKEKY